MPSAPTTRPRAPELPADPQTDGAATLDGGALDGRILEHAHARRRARRRDERVVETQAALGQHGRRRASGANDGKVASASSPKP
jgi:hypothetical protein